MKVRVYVCPTEGCGNYYGSSGMGDLATAKNYAANSGTVVMGTRDECPDCKARGALVRREPREVVLVP